MRLILFFDLPVKTHQNLTAYRKFVRNIKKSGFYMLQESVYVKMCMDNRMASSYVQTVKEFTPEEGNVIILTITEKQFASMDHLFGENKTDVINSDDRFIEL